MRRVHALSSVEGGVVNPSRFHGLSRLWAAIRAARFALVPYGFCSLGGSGGSNSSDKSPPEENTSKSDREDRFMRNGEVRQKFEPPSRPGSRRPPDRGRSRNVPAPVGSHYRMSMKYTNTDQRDRSERKVER